MVYSLWHGFSDKGSLEVMDISCLVTDDVATSLPSQHSHHPHQSQSLEVLGLQSIYALISRHGTAVTSSNSSSSSSSASNRDSNSGYNKSAYSNYNNSHTQTKSTLCHAIHCGNHQTLVAMIDLLLQGRHTYIHACILYFLILFTILFNIDFYLFIFNIDFYLFLPTPYLLGRRL